MVLFAEQCFTAWKVCHLFIHLSPWKFEFLLWALKNKIAMNAGNVAQW